MKKKRFLTAALLLSLLWISGISVCAAEIQGKEQSGSGVTSQEGFIFANGEPLLIVATEPGYGKLYIDSNRDAQVSDGEAEITLLEPSDYYSYDSDRGFYLANTSIYGGCLSSDFTGDTYVALIGPYSGFQDISEGSAPKGTVWNIYGGNAYGNITGSTQVIIAGGKVGNWVIGGANSTVVGNTNITMTDGFVAGSICGGGSAGNVTGTAAVTISGGTVNYWIIGGGELSGSVTGSTQVIMSGGLVCGSICGGGQYGNVTGDTHVEVTGGTVVYDVIGGNGRGGAVNGNTYVTLGGSAQVNEFVCGGGAGYDPNTLVTVTGDTHVTLKDNAVIGVQGGGPILGGGIEYSIVEGNVFMEIQGGIVSTVIPGGNLYPTDGVSGTGDASITMTGGNVTSLANWGYDSSQSTVGALTLNVSDADFSGTTFNIGCDTDGASLGDVSVTIDSCKIAGMYFGNSGTAIAGNLSVTFHGTTVENLHLNSPIAGDVDISFDVSQAAYFHLAQDVLNPNADSKLAFLECGSPDRKWGYFPYLSTTLSDAENPVLYGKYMNGNQFKTIQLTNSYISMAGESEASGTSPSSYTEKLIVDGGVLRICGLSAIVMPETEFRNDPLLMNSMEDSSSGNPIRFNTVPNGTARLKWLASDGDSSRVVTCNYDCITEAPSSAADTIFSSEEDSYVLKTENVTVSGGNTTLWKGKGWFIGSLDDWCRCDVSKPDFENYIFPVSNTQESFSLVLREVSEGSADPTVNCPVVGHKGQTTTVSYELMDYTTADASIDSENRLTVSGTGCVDVAVTKSVNGRSSSDTVSFYFVGMPASSEYENVYQSAEDLFLEFDIKGIDAVSATASNSYIYSKTLNKVVSDYKIEVQNDKLILTLPKEYINSLEKKDYDMEAVINLKGSRYLYYSFTLSITDKRTPEGAPRLSADSLVYGNASNTITLSGDMSYKSLPVKGTFTLVSPETIPEVPADGSYPLAWTFTPENTDLYLETTGTSALVIKPRQVTLTWSGTETRTYDGTPSNVTASPGNLFGQDEITVIVNGGDNADAGTHTATALRLVGEKAGNYVLPASASINYTIKPASGIASITMEGWTYSPDNAGHKAPIPVSPTNGTENVTFLYKPKDAPDTAYKASLPSEAGEYTVKAVFAATGNYAETTATADFVIGRAPKPDNLPDSGTILPPASGQADSLKDLSAPEGWKWKDDTLKLVPGGSISAVLIYHDTENYEQYEMTILISKLPELIASTTDSEYTIGEDRSSTIHCTGALQELTGVLMDGAKVDPANYTLKEGSTILTFSEKYMNRLSLGVHQVTLVYNAGNVNAVINVKEKSNSGNQNPEPDKGPGSSDDTSPDKDPTPSDNDTQEEDSPSSDNNAQEEDSTHTEQSTLSKKRRAPATGEPGNTVENSHDTWTFVPVTAIAMAAVLIGTLCIVVVLRSRKKNI
ncbi:MAG: hypothetical protein HFH87_05255 [Lachnospiraceae bacterium]|nr:hypothetical protein [Lachnospiraceae bacterium]